MAIVTPEQWYKIFWLSWTLGALAGFAIVNFYTTKWATMAAIEAMNR